MKVPDRKVIKFPAFSFHTQTRINLPVVLGCWSDFLTPQYDHPLGKERHKTKRDVENESIGKHFFRGPWWWCYHTDPHSNTKLHFKMMALTHHYAGIIPLISSNVYRSHLHIIILKALLTSEGCLSIETVFRMSLHGNQPDQCWSWKNVCLYYGYLKFINLIWITWTANQIQCSASQFKS